MKVELKQTLTHAELLKFKIWIVSLKYANIDGDTGKRPIFYENYTMQIQRKTISVHAKTDI